MQVVRLASSLRGAISATLLAATVSPSAVRAEAPPRPFTVGTMRALVSEHAAAPLLIRFWSLDCTYCMQEMKALKALSVRHPDWRLVLVSTDATAHAASAAAVLRREGFDPGASFIFSHPNSQKLRFDIDRKWYGELPRTYLYMRGSQVAAQSGAIEPADVERKLAPEAPAFVSAHRQVRR